MWVCNPRAPAVHDNALEFLDNVLKPQLREMLLPLLDSKVTVRERADRAQRLVHTNIENQEQAVAALVASEDPWLKVLRRVRRGSVWLEIIRKSVESMPERFRSIAARDRQNSQNPPGRANY